MAGVTITQLPVAGTITGTEEVPIWQSGSTRKASVSSLSTTVRRTVSLAFNQVMGRKIAAMYVDQQIANGNATGQLAASVNLARLVPFPVFDAFTINQVGVLVAVASVTAPHTARIAIYSSTATGVPNQKVAEANLTGLNATGFISATLNFPFQSDTLYWIAVHFNANPTIQSLLSLSSIPLGYSSATATTPNISLQRTITYASGLPTSWAYTGTDLSTNPGFIVRMRVA